MLQLPIKDYHPHPTNNLSFTRQNTHTRQYKTQSILKIYPLRLHLHRSLRPHFVLVVIIIIRATNHRRWCGDVLLEEEVSLEEPGHANTGFVRYELGRWDGEDLCKGR